MNEKDAIARGIVCEARFRMDPVDLLELCVGIEESKTREVKAGPITYEDLVKYDQIRRFVGRTSTEGLINAGNDFIDEAEYLQRDENGTVREHILRKDNEWQW